MSSDPDPAPADLAQQLAALQATVASLAEAPRRRGPGAWPLVVLLLVALAWTQDALGLRTRLSGPEGGSVAARPAAGGVEQPAVSEAGEADRVAVREVGTDADVDADAGPDAATEGAAPAPAVEPSSPRPELDVGALEARLDDVIAKRNELFAENVRLRNQVLELEQRVAALIQLRDQAVVLDAEPEPPRITSTEERTPDPWLDALHDALQGSGVSHLRVVEGRLHAGALHDVLLAELDLMGHTREVRRLERIELSSDAGVVYLELTPEIDPLALQHVVDLQDGVPADPPLIVAAERVRLARWDAQLWAPTGLTLPVVLLPVEEVQHALSELLAGHDLEVQHLGGFDGGQLLDLQLTEREPGGAAVRRRLSAARAVIVADGPALLLYDGEVVQDGEARAFYKGRHKLPLPGADHEAWRAAIGG